MRVALVSRYPRVDVPGWKRALAQGLLDSGFDLSVVYSRSSPLMRAQLSIEHATREL